MTAGTQQFSSRMIRRRGAILIVALVVTFTLASMVLVLCQEMRVEAVAAGNRAASAQCDAIERGAEQYVQAVLAQEGESIADLSDDQFAAIQVGDGYFWVLRPQYDDPQMPIFGLMPESGKLNINTATYDELLLLPGMTEDVADSIIDWRDADDTPRTNGAENDYYPNLTDPYTTKDSNFETVEELLMVRNVTREMLYGDGTAPPLGQASSMFQSSTGTLDVDPQVPRGLLDVLTVYSSEPAGGAAGKININDRNQQAQLQQMLTTQLSAGRATAIMSLLGNTRRNPVRDVIDFYFRVRMTADELNKVYDRLSTGTTTAATGLVNVNVAPRSVLLCLPNLTSDDADKLISARDSAAPEPGEIGWAIDALGQKAVGLGTAITAHSYQYTADILAASGNGRSFSRVRVVIDNSTGTPQIVYRRDISDRGWPMDPQILASLRSGQGIGNTGVAGGQTAGSSLGGTH